MEFAVVWRVPLPAYLMRWQDACSLLLTPTMIFMFTDDPTLHCIRENYDLENLGL